MEQRRINWAPLCSRTRGAKRTIKIIYRWTQNFRSFFFPPSIRKMFFTFSLLGFVCVVDYFTTTIAARRESERNASIAQFAFDVRPRQTLKGGDPVCRFRFFTTECVIFSVHSNLWIKTVVKLIKERRETFRETLSDKKTRRRSNSWEKNCKNCWKLLEKSWRRILKSEEKEK